MKEEYEKKRKDLKYYSKSLEIIEKIKNDNNSKSIIDIGGWAGGFISRTSLETNSTIWPLREASDAAFNESETVWDEMRWILKISVNLDNAKALLTLLKSGSVLKSLS